MNRYDLLIALQEAEERANKHCIEVVESEKLKGNPVFHLYDPRNDAPIQSPPQHIRKRPGAIRYGKSKPRSELD